jgi:hypothetical protein
MRATVLGNAAVLVLASTGWAQTMCGVWENPPPLIGHVRSIVEFQGEVYIGGSFFGANGNYVTRWNGTSYVPLPQQLPSQVTMLAVLDDGTGPALYAGGSSWNLGPLPSNTAMGVVKWNGQSWSGTGFPFNPGGAGVTDMVVYDDGTGPAVYAASPGTSQNLWRRSGGAWSLVAGAPSGKSLAVFDDGAGPALYSGGTFTVAGGVFARSIAKLRQGVWSEVGGGLTYNGGGPGAVSCLRVLDLGQGPRLFAGGGFNRAGTVPVHFIASWDGAAWTGYRFAGYQQFGVTAGDLVSSFAALRETHPPLLLVGMTLFYTYPDPQLQGGVLAWDGERWFQAGLPATGQVYAMLPREGAGSSKVLVGGWMPGPVALGTWTPCPQCYANCDWSTAAPVLNVNDFACFLQKFTAGDVWANCDTSSASPALNVNDFVCFMGKFAAGCGG